MLKFLNFIMELLVCLEIISKTVLNLLDILEKCVANSGDIGEILA